MLIIDGCDLLVPLRLRDGALMLITNSTTGENFIAEASIDLVSSALRNDFSVGHSCRQGVCGSCRARVTCGTFSLIGSEELVTIGAEDEPKDVLLCQTIAHSAITLAHTPQSDQERSAAQIVSIDILNDDVAHVILSVVTGSGFAFKPGQFIGICWQGGQLKYFSIANTPNDSNLVELHIRKQADGIFTQWLFNEALPGDVLGIEGPIGDFGWTTPAQRPVILLATGTGFSPIKSIVQGHLLQAHPGGVFLYWGGRQQSDLYLFELASAWEQESPHFKFIPVLSRSSGTDWVGRTGRLPEAVLADHRDLSSYDVYACGSPEVIANAKQQFVAKAGLEPSRFYSDPFNAPAPVAAKPLVSFPVEFSHSPLRGRVTSEVGVTLLQALINNGLNLDHYCCGGAVCATCRVNVSSDGVAPPKEFEQDLLDCVSDFQTGDRLACQLVISDELRQSVVHLPGHPKYISRLQECDDATER